MKGGKRFVLLGNGAWFSQQVFANLIERRAVPLAIAIPEFAPAPITGQAKLEVTTLDNRNPLVTRAQDLSIPIIYAPRTRQPELVTELETYGVDYLLVACWPYLIQPAVASSAGKAALNLHPSLLPNYRGADPVTAQLENRETRMGITLHLLSDEFDRGDIVGQMELAYEDEFKQRHYFESVAAAAGVNLFLSRHST